MTWLEYGGRLRKLPEGTTVIGGGPESALILEDADLMPRHVILHPRADHVEVAAFSPDVVVCVSGRQIGTDAWTAQYGEPIQAGSATFHVWSEQPAQHLAEPAAIPRAYLVDERQAVAWPLDRIVTSIGRSSANVIRLTDPTASRFHAQVRREAGGFALHVMGSAGGAINGRRTSAPTMLSDGDVVEMAYTNFRFTHGPVPDGVRIIPVDVGASPEMTERPTSVRERISLAQPRPAPPPGILRTAVVLGVVTAVAAALAALALLL